MNTKPTNKQPPKASFFFITEEREREMRLWHCSSARSIRPLWALHEMGLEEECELITMPFPPRVRYPRFLKTNVLGTIPYFEDGPHVRMTESVAITLYLAGKYQSSLLVRPEEPEYASFMNWCVHAEATLTFPQTVVLRYTLQEPGIADEAARGYAKWYVARLRLLNNALADGREYLCAKRFTCADICVAFALYMGQMLKTDGKTLASFYKPQTKRYLERMLARPSWKACLEHERRSMESFEQSCKSRL